MSAPVIVVALAREARGFPARRCLTTTAVVRRDCLYSGQRPAKPGTLFRLSNGRLPEFQPIVSEQEARAWLAENPNAIAWEVRP